MTYHQNLDVMVKIDRKTKIIEVYDFHKIYEGATGTQIGSITFEKLAEVIKKLNLKEVLE